MPKKDIKKRKKNNIKDKVQNTTKMRKDTEFSEEHEVAKVNSKEQLKARPEVNPQQNMNYLRNKQLY